MGTIAYYIFYGVNWIITLLPLRILYISSDILFLFLYYFPSYRRKIVVENLRNSFPEKSAKEIALIEKKFYRHLADLFVEILKLTHLSDKELKRRVTVTNPEVINEFCDSGRDVAVAYCHYNNWEWLSIGFSLYTKYKCMGSIKPLKNKMLNDFINNLRVRSNAEVAPMQMIIRRIFENRSNNIRAVYGFITDQTPAKSMIGYFTDFLNQETPVFLGIEKIAEKFDMPVMFLDCQKIRRGYYSMTIELLFESTRDLPKYKVTKTHVKRLEQMINKNPEYWLWTHRRWKYKKETVND